jgi:hypothetical protein
MRNLCVRGVAASSAVVGFALLGGAASAVAAVPTYALVGSFELPTGAGAFDVLPDGRLVTLLGSEFHLQSGVNAGGFAKAGSVPSSFINSFGASFIKASPDGSRFAVGDGNFGGTARVLFVDAASLNPAGDSAFTSVVTPNYDATWADSSTLLVTGASASFESVVSRVGAVTLTSSTVLTGVGDGSGGVAVRNGRAYVGVGFDVAPGAGAETGDIRAFDLATLLGTATPIGFGTSGTLAARALSGGFLAFDGAGNLSVGGGDFSGESGFATVLDGSILDAALVGGPFATSANGLTLAPAGNQFYSTAFNAATNEFLVRAFGDDTVFRYAVPAPSVGMMVLLSGLFAHRRRRA